MNRINIKEMMVERFFDFMVNRAKELNACGRYLLVYVYRAADGVDCSLHGVTSRFTQLYVPCPGGNYTLEDLADKRDQMLEVIPPAMPGCPYRFRPTCIPKGKHSMAGGNFVHSTDSRFSAEYGAPISVHDRVE